MTATPGQDEDRDAGWEDSLLVWNATVARVREPAVPSAPVEGSTEEPGSDAPSEAAGD